MTRTGIAVEGFVLEDLDLGFGLSWFALLGQSSIVLISIGPLDANDGPREMSTSSHEECPGAPVFSADLHLLELGEVFGGRGGRREHGLVYADLGRGRGMEPY